MHLLQDTFNEVLHDQFSFPVLTARLFRKRLEQEGITLTDGQVEQVTTIFERLEKDGNFGQGLTITVEDDGQVTSSLEKSGSGLVIDLAENADEELDKIFEKLPVVINEMAVETSIILLKTLKKDARRMLREHARIQREFDKRLYQKWEKPLELMEMFLVIAEEAGSEFNHYICSTTDASKVYKFEVLRRLHARACQVAKEVMTLLKSGFADGADARWRTLHEISVVAGLIADNDDQLAERYLLHEIVERYQFARIYQEHCDRLGFERVTDEEIEALQNEVEGLTNRFGPEFKEEYGWAAVVVGKKKPNFTDLEAKIDLKL